jgi:hypothetical protein
MTDFHGVSNIEQTTKIPFVRLIEDQLRLELTELCDLNHL